MPNNKIAHRGIFDNDKIPENSIKAFKKALKYNYPIELDISITKDNKLIVFHDTNLKRMTGVDKLVEETSYNEIKNYTLLETNEYIPTLKEVLKIINSKVLLDIEVKDTKKIEEVCDRLKNELKDYNNYILKSFNPKIVRYLKKNNPSIKVGYLISSKHKLLSNILFIKYSKADFLSISKDLLPTKKYQKLKKKYPLMIWTIKEKDEILDNQLTYICNHLPY